MASRDQKDEPFVPSWDGEVQGWSEYWRRVRKRYTLGPKLVLRLRGKAWEAAASVGHSRLCQPDGTSYFILFAPIPQGQAWPIAGPRCGAAPGGALCAIA